MSEEREMLMKMMTLGAVLEYKESLRPLSAIDLLKKATAAGHKAAEKSRPIPMVVQEHVNMLDDSSPVKQSWVVPGGVCGFAWVIVRCTNKESRKFINDLKKAGIASPDVNDWSPKVVFKKASYYKGYMYYCPLMTQSMTLKEDFCQAFAKVLHDTGINAHSMSRMD